MASIDQQAKGGKQGDVRYLTPLDIDTKKEAKYCRFKKKGIKYIDYKDADFLMYLVNEQGKILPRRLTGTSLKARCFKVSANTFLAELVAKTACP